MARRGTHHLWLAMLLVAAGVGLAGAAIADEPESRPSGAQGAVVRVTSTGGEIAVVPPRTEAGVGKSAHPISGRTILPLVAALLGVAAAAGLSAARRHAAPDGARTLLARRHAIALRAPPSFQLA
ncbi:MAG TPA: hypothetical protein VF244_06460 [Acidimicrobiales bacterium]